MTLRALNRRWPDALPMLALIILWLVFFWRLFTPTPSDRLSISQSDFSSQYYNFSVYQARRFDAGNLLPLWNPLNYGGSPFLADPQASVVYPVRWLFLTLYGGGRWSYAGLEVEVMAHFLLTSLLMYALARQITGKPLGGLIAAIAYTYGGYLNSFPVQQVTILESGTWLPLALIGLHWATRSDGGASRWGWLIVAGIGMGLVILGGHPQIAMLCGYLSIAYLGVRVYSGTRSWRDFFVGAALFVVIGGGLAAVLLLPTAEFQQWATRAGELSYTSKAGGYPFTDALQLLWSTMITLYAPMYIGVAGLALAGIAVAYRRSLSMFWLVAGVTGLILSFGGKTSLFQFAYTLVPGASLFRDQERTVMIWSFCASVLAGIGAARLIDGLEPGEWRWLRRTLWAVAGLTFATLMLLHAGVTASTNSAMQVAAYTVLVAALVAAILPWVAQNAQNGAARRAVLVGVLVFDLFSVSQGGPAYSPGSPDSILPDAPWMAEMRTLLTADPFARIDGTDKLGPFGSLYGFPAIRGTSPLHLAGTERLLNLPPAKTWDLLAVRYVVSAEAQLPVESRRLRDVNDWSGSYFVYELDDPRPLATLVYAADVIANDDYAAQVMAAPDYPVRDKAVLPQAPPLSLAGQRPPDTAVILLEIAPEHFKVRASTSADALLLVSIPYHPGWQAAASGQSLNVVRADLGLMAVPLPAGSYEIAFDFDPASVQVGAAISALVLVLTLIGLAAWVWLALRRRA